MDSYIATLSGEEKIELWKKLGNQLAQANSRRFEHCVSNMIFQAANKPTETSAVSKSLVRAMVSVAHFEESMDYVESQGTWAPRLYGEN